MEKTVFALIEGSRSCFLLCAVMVLAPSVGTAAAQAAPGQVRQSQPNLVPKLSGEWLQLTQRPPLERWGTPKAEPVDFTVFKASDGRWQLISCIRHTSQPGKGRLLYRWSSAQLAERNWRPDGIFLEATGKDGHAEGLLQAPHCIYEDGKYHLFYNSRGAHLMTSRDGLVFTPFLKEDGGRTLFDMGRDVMVFDDRQRSGRWLAYYTAVVPGLNLRTKDHTVHVRSATQLTGPWSEEAIDVGTPTEPPAGYLFAYAESPFIVFRDGWYYRFEQMVVYASRDPLRWERPALTVLMPKDPMRYLAPEIVSDQGNDYVLAYGWRGKDPSGIFIARLEWARLGSVSGK